ncbi:inositol monophosphatase family protein [Profundibacterium mesophilum]|uniref:inositol monophosphatase family protein n=1 Tax=Profundibacterium mesophilum TaxID=1258573 RepID=UPI001F3E42AC|nr:inositol monophosphatase family protein [Profundibacterium mesophilum]
MDTDTLADLEAVAHAVADAARPATLRHFRSDALDVSNKRVGGFDPVTEGDRAAETAMRAVLGEWRPQDAILGEEFGHSDGQSGLCWVLDPIDGTRAYLCGAPTWGVLVAVGGDEGPVLGLIDQPFTKERFFGGPGGAFWDGPLGRRRLRTRPPRGLDEAIVLSTFPEIGTEEEHAAFTAVSRAAKLTRYGLDCYGYALLAAGQVDLVIEAGLQSYDIHGPMAVIEAAGGVVTTWDGGPARHGGRIVAAANLEIHAAACARLAGG